MRRVVITVLFFLTLFSAAVQPARAQSADLKGSLRVHDARALPLAEEELRRCELVACSELGELSLLVGTLQLSDGRAAQARTQLRSHAVSEVLRPYLAFYSGQADFYSGDFQAAAAQFELASHGSPVGLTQRANAREAESWLASGDARRALPLLTGALRDGTTPELLLSRAKALLLLEDNPGAAADLHTLLVRFPLSLQAPDAEALAKEHAKLHLKWSLEDHLTRARAFLESSNFSTAAGELTRAETEHLVKTPRERAEVALIRAGFLYGQGKEPEADAQVQKAQGGDARVASDALLLKAKRRMRGPGAHPEAQALMEDVERRFPRQPAAEEAGFLDGFLLVQGAQFAAAAERLGSYDVRYPHARKRDEANWYQAYALIRAGRYGDATTALDKLSARFPHSSLLPQARYWAARSRELGKSGAPIQGYKDVIVLFPGTFYALLAAQRLQDTGQLVPPAFAQKPVTLPPLSSPELALARTLASAGLLRDSAEEIARRTSAVHGVDAALALARSLTALEEHGAAYGLAARLLWGEAYTQHSPLALALLYPKAFAASLEANARAQGVSPFLLWAIMRRESTFRANLTSAANARGLMQLIPPTASAIARALKEDPPPADSLYSPEVNLRLSAWYLAQLDRRFHSSVLVAAAYNAGPQAAARWAQAFGQMPLDLFVETIPYKETRVYVKQVVADEYNYQAFYGTAQDLAPLSFNVPAPARDGINF